MTVQSQESRTTIMEQIKQNMGFVEELASNINVPVDLIKTMILMLGTLILTPPFRIMTNPVIRQAYSLVLGLAYVYYMQKQWTLYVLAVALVPYLLMKLVSSKSFQISLITSFCFLLFIHAYRYIFDYYSWKIDCSVTVMYLVTKVVYYGHHISKTHAQQSLFTYMSYCFFFPSVMIGPSFRYDLFQDFIFRPHSNMPIKSALSGNLLSTMVFAVLTGMLMPIFTSDWIVTNPTFVALPAIVQYLTLNVVGLIYRLKFYMAWGFTQISINLSGLSWDKEGSNYDKIVCGSFKFQTQINPKIKTAYWNTSIQYWLKEMIYDKLIEKTKSSSVATYVTFVISAFWHGIHLTYYIGFIEWAVIVQISKWAYKVSLAAPEIAQSAITRFLAYFVSQNMINYTGMFIVVLTWKQAIQAYENMMYIGNIIMATMLIVSMTVSPKVFAVKKKAPILQ